MLILRLLTALAPHRTSRHGAEMSALGAQETHLVRPGRSAYWDSAELFSTVKTGLGIDDQDLFTDIWPYGVGSRISEGTYAASSSRLFSGGLAAKDRQVCYAQS
jgi:hypothetical protein